MRIRTHIALLHLGVGYRLQGNMTKTAKNSRPSKPCTQPGCRVLVNDGNPKCESHRMQWAKRGDQPERMRGSRLQRARKVLFTLDPLCAECKRQGRITLAVERDHIVSLGEGGLDEPENTQGLCIPCHAAKSLAERLRGINRD